MPAAKPGGTLERNMRIGRAIRMLRERADMTQADLAQKASVDVKTISRIETGGYNPSLATLETLAELFGVTLDAVAGRSNVKPLSIVRTPPVKSHGDDDQIAALGKAVGLLQQSVNQLIQTGKQHNSAYDALVRRVNALETRRESTKQPQRKAAH